MDFMSTGKTYRDYASLTEAARSGELDGDIFHGSELIKFRKGSQTNVQNRPRLTNAEVIQALSTAKVVVIPVADPPEPNGLTGITELADAVAIGKPIVMTKNALLPVDIEALGIGVVVPEGADPGTLLSAIRRAQSVNRKTILRVSEEWNARNFSRSMLDIFQSVL
ncbi:UNVERIFIED_ORG: glycosyltransferase involved in cell wall biosynthesis [Arthrobacter sp. UYEF10]